MKHIIFVDMVNSVDAARWTSQIVDGVWRILLFPVEQGMFHPAPPELKFSILIYLSPSLRKRFFPEFMAHYGDWIDVFSPILLNPCRKTQ